MCGFCNTVRSIKTSGDALADGVIYGTAWKGPITYFFTNSQNDYNYSYEAEKNFAPVTQQQASAALFALDKAFGNSANNGFSVEGFTNVSISMGDAETSTIRFAQSDAPTTAYAYVPGKYDQAGDMWFGREFDYTNAEAGNYAWHSILHEIGHALGLKHGNESRNGFAALPSQYDSLEYSIMTYRSYEGSDVTRYTYSEWSAPQTYMMADIAALQKLYGADFSTNSGNTVYSWRPDSGDTFVNGKVGVSAGGDVIFATVWDGGGKDTYDLSLYSADLTINLAAGGHSAFGSDQLAELGADQHASGSIYNALRYNGDKRSLIENAIGGLGNDTIGGNAVNNKLTGGAGDDTMTGRSGNDRLLGGSGNDILLGGAGRDFLSGGTGNDVLTGGRDHDVFQFRAGDGADTITDFNNGVDHLRFDIENFVVAQAVRDAVQVGENLVITYDGSNTVTLLNFDKADLDARDFLLAA